MNKVLKSLFLVILVNSLLIVGCAQNGQVVHVHEDTIGDEWYKGGTLHSATVETWNQSSYENRLATSADWFVLFTKKYNSNLQRLLDSMSGTQYFLTLKAYTGILERCITGKVKYHTGEQTFKESDKAAEAAKICHRSNFKKGNWEKFIR